jgi:hypothetical protein
MISDKHMAATAHQQAERSGDGDGGDGCEGVVVAQQSARHRVGPAHRLKDGDEHPQEPRRYRRVLIQQLSHRHSNMHISLHKIAVDSAPSATDTALRRGLLAREDALCLWACKQNQEGGMPTCGSAVRMEQQYGNTPACCQPPAPSALCPPRFGTGLWRPLLHRPPPSPPNSTPSVCKHQLSATCVSLDESSTEKMMMYGI